MNDKEFCFLYSFFNFKVFFLPQLQTKETTSIEEILTTMSNPRPKMMGSRSILTALIMDLKQNF